MKNGMKNSRLVIAVLVAAFGLAGCGDSDLFDVKNPGKIPLELIEVQTGSYLGEDDIQRFDDDFGRAGRVSDTSSKQKETEQDASS